MKGTHAMHKVRTTTNPDKEIEVDDAELADLRAQGLLVGDEIAADETQTADADHHHKQTKGGGHHTADEKERQ